MVERESAEDLCLVELLQISSCLQGLISVVFCSDCVVHFGVVIEFVGDDLGSQRVG